MSQSFSSQFFIDIFKKIGASPEFISISSVAIQVGDEITTYVLGNGNGMPILDIEDARRLRQEGQSIYEVKVHKVE